MALISEIRKRMWIVVLLIGIAMGGFILQDATSSHGFFRGNKETVGKINGQKINIRDFQKEMSEDSRPDQGAQFAKVSQTWEKMIQEVLLAQETEKLGIQVSAKELDDLLYGEHPSPIVLQQLRNPQTGQFNPEEAKKAIQAAKTANEPKRREAAERLIKEVSQNRLREKFINLVNKSIYTPSWMAEKEFKSMNSPMDIAFVNLPYSVVPDDQVKVEDNEINDYIKAHPAEFEDKKDPSANIEYIAFDVKPTAQDSANVRNGLMKLKADMAASKDDSTYVESQVGGEIQAYKNRAAMGAMPMTDSFFSASKGRVFGPYLNGGSMYLAKVLDTRMVPDSVKAHHILRQYKSPEEKKAARHLLDSVKTQIESGKITFKMAADSLTQDPSGKGKGGDLGSFPQGQMVKEFNNICFYTGDAGRMYIVETQFGLHLIYIDAQINKQPSVQVAYVKRTMSPSKETQNTIYQEALGFIGNNRTLEAFRKVAKDKNYKLTPANGLGQNTYYVMGLEPQDAARDLIKWANVDAKVNDVCKAPFVFNNREDNYVNKYVVAAVVSKKGKGLPTAADVREQIAPKVRNKKKAELIKTKIGSQTDLKAIASMYNVNVDTARGVSLAARTSALGQDPASIGAAMKVNPGSVSKPVVGRQGVYMLYVISKNDPANIPDKQNQRRAVTGRMSNSAGYVALNALRMAGTIDDYRSDFY